MSNLTDVLHSGASCIAGAVSDKLGIDLATARNLIDSGLPADQAKVASADEGQSEVADQGDAAPVLEEESMFGKVTAMLGGTQAITDKAKQLLDQDGDGNPLNDVTNMVGKFFAKD